MFSLYSGSELSSKVSKSEKSILIVSKAKAFSQLLIKKKKIKPTIKYAIYQLIIVLFSMLPIIFIEENIVRNAILNNISKIDVNKDYSLKELACILNVSIATLRKYISKNIDISERKINYA